MESISHINSLFDSNAASGICFKDYEVCEGERLERLQAESNHLVFLLSGELSVQYNEFHPIRIKSGELFLLPKSTQYAMVSLSPSHQMVCSFDSLSSIHNKLRFRNYTAMLPQMQFSFAALPIHPVLRQYLLIFIEYMKNGIDSELICKLKFQELFLLLEGLYNKEEMAGLFYPILGQSLDFKNRVMQYFSHVNNVDELSRKMGMGRANFDMKFKKEFGMTPLQWILKEKAKHVYFSLSEPENTLNDIMNKYNFNSFTHLNRFCKQQFGCSPSELRKRLSRND
jgi:AraC-like DNA-binding protein